MPKLKANWVTKGLKNLGKVGEYRRCKGVINRSVFKGIIVVKGRKGERRRDKRNLPKLGANLAH